MRIKIGILYFFSLMLGLVIIKIGLDFGVLGGINTVLFFSVITMIIFAKNMKWRYFRELKIALLLYLVVIISAFISLFYTDSIKISSKFIRTDLFAPIIIFIFIFFIFRMANGFSWFNNKKAFNIFLISFSISLVALCVFMIMNYVHLYNVFKSLNISASYIRATASSHNLINPFANWHLIALTFFISLFIFTKNKYLKILCILLCLLAIASLIASGARMFLFGIIACIISIFLILKYKYKKRIVLSCFIFFIVAITLFVNYSGTLNLMQNRFNIKNMIDNFSLVMSKSPASMGIYDINCTPKICSYLSFPRDKNISQDESSLIRLSLTKTTLLAIKQNPFKPNGFGHNLFIKNIEKNYFDPFSENYPYFYATASRQDISNKDIDFKQKARIYNGFDMNANVNALNIPQAQMHNHFQLLSLIFELGIIAFICIVIFAIMQFIFAYKNLAFFILKDQRLYAAFSLFIMLNIICDTIVMFFDIMLYTGGLVQLFILFGINSALYYNIRDKDGYFCK